MSLFTYGSLMFPEVWLRVAGAAFPSQAATLGDHAAWKVKGQTYPGLARAPGHVVDGVVYFDVAAAAAARLDTFEGDFYFRKPVSVRLADGRSIEVDVYLVRDEFRDSLSDELWDADEFRANHLNSFIGPQRIR